MKRFVVVVVLVLVAGCFQPDKDSVDDDLWAVEPPRMPDRPGCVEYVCPADPTHRDAVWVQETLGWERLTDDDSHPRSVSFDGEWVVWISYGYYPPDHPDIRDRTIFALHLPTRAVDRVSPDVGLNILPKLDQGRVLYEHSSGEWQGLALWDAESKQTVRLDPGLGSTYRPYGLEGEWVLFMVRSGPVEEDLGLWAWNLADDRKLHLYQEVNTSREFGAKDTHLFIDADIHNATAYFIVRHGHGNPGEDDARPPTHTIHEFNLETGVERVFHDDEQGNAGDAAAIEGYLVYQRPPDVVVLNLTTGESRNLVNPGERHCAGPRAAGELVVFRCSDPRVIRVANVVTGDLIDLHEHEKTLWLERDTDGTSVVAVIRLNDSRYFEVNRHDLYVLWDPFAK